MTEEISNFSSDEDGNSKEAKRLNSCDMNQSKGSPTMRDLNITDKFEMKRTMPGSLNASVSLDHRKSLGQPSKFRSSMIKTN